MSLPSWTDPLREYRIPGADWALRFASDAVALFARHVQTRRWSRESVGQLYTRDLTSKTVMVDVATLLKPSWAAWAGVGINRKRATEEREDMFNDGLHCIGLWHTHPELDPKPSPHDLTLAADYAVASKAQMAGIVFVIVGTAGSDDGMLVGVHDGDAFRAAVGEMATITDSGAPAIGVAPPRRSVA